MTTSESTTDFFTDGKSENNAADSSDLSFEGSTFQNIPVGTYEAEIVATNSDKDNPFEVVDGTARGGVPNKRITIGFQIKVDENLKKAGFDGETALQKDAMWFYRKEGDTKFKPSNVFRQKWLPVFQICEKEGLKALLGKRFQVQVSPNPKNEKYCLVTPIKLL